jgi:hypothetical protein
MWYISDNAACHAVIAKGSTIRHALEMCPTRLFQLKPTKIWRNLESKKGFTLLRAMPDGTVKPVKVRNLYRVTIFDVYSEGKVPPFMNVTAIDEDMARAVVDAAILCNTDCRPSDYQITSVTPAQSGGE